MYFVEKLYNPATLDEALGILAAEEGVWPLAGATDVLVKMRHSRIRA